MVLPVSTSSPVQMISSCMPGLSGSGQGWPVDTKITPQRGERLAPEGEPREHVTHHRGQGEAVAGKARGHEEPLDAGHGADHGQLVGQEGLQPDPAPVERAGCHGRIDLARHFQAAADALLEDLPAIRLVVHYASRPAAGLVKSIWSGRVWSGSVMPCGASSGAVQAPAVTTETSHGWREPSPRSTPTTRPPSMDSALTATPSSTRAPCRRAAAA